MNHAAAADVYRRSAVENAPPIKVVRLLYEGALRFLAKAREFDAKDPRSQFVEFTSRADAIVTELRAALDHSLNDEVTESLEQLYLFCGSELSRALLERTADPIPAVERVLRTLLDGWLHVEAETTRTAR
ncbi:MAG: flagellar export chaperone FliS [Planctomycetota bacterium]